MKAALFAAAAAAALAPCAAHAEPGLAGEVYGPTVTAGETEVEVRAGFLNGGDADGEWQTKFEVAHAFTDWWRPALLAEWERETGDAEFTAFAIENVFDFTATRTWPVHFGAYAEYEWAEEGPNELELKLLMQRERGPVDLRLNLITARVFGDGPEDIWEFGYAAEASYGWGDDFRIGVQGFGDAGTDDDFGLDEQAHYWGPFTQVELGHVGGGEVELQLGYLAGFGEAEADGQLRMKLEYEFRDSDD
ncbi:hypothetical protein [Terricaulis sp.]|uniref:hypothetical protein n=1 Tax=Terricaulis sp. TaxID=2768686 RepID=UPI003782F2FD